MGAMLQQGRLEFGEKLLGHISRMTAAPQECEQLLLAGNVSFALGDMVVHHLEIGRTEGHEPIYHLGGGKSSSE